MKRLLDRFKSEVYPILEILEREVDSGNVIPVYTRDIWGHVHFFTFYYKDFRVYVSKNGLDLDLVEVELKPLDRLKVRRLFKKLLKLKKKQEKLKISEELRKVVDDFKNRTEE